MSGPCFTFTLYLSVDDELALERAATQKAVDDGLDFEDWSAMRKSIYDDLVMLLDPGGSLSHAGISIHDSTVER